MSDTNDQTIATYNTHAQKYRENTPSTLNDGLKAWYADVFHGVAKAANIMEFGSAYGRDAQYIQSLGYAVQCSDATPAFVDMLRESGLMARQLNVITDELPRGMDVIFANAVFVHFTQEETRKVIEKVYAALNSGGTFACTLMIGDGERMTGDADEKLGASRYFCYWQDTEIRTCLHNASFSDIKIDTYGNDRWLCIIARKHA